MSINIVVKNALGENFDVTEIATNIVFTSSLDTIATTLSFDIAYNNNDDNFPVNPCDVGNIINVYTYENNVFDGIIIEERKQDFQSVSYHAVDYSFYLSRSKYNWQFNKMTAQSAILQIVLRYGIEIKSIAPENTLISTIAINRAGSDVLDDIINIIFEQTGKEYHYRMSEGKFVFGEMNESVGVLTYSNEDADITATNVMETASNVTRTRSIDNLKNSIAIYFQENSKTGKKYIQQAVVDDVESIGKYGLLREQLEGGEYTRQIRKRRRSKVKAKHTYAQALNSLIEAKTKAANMLKKLNRVFDEITITTLGNELAIAGKIIAYEDEFTGAKGDYLITDATHTWRGSGYTMSLTLANLMED